MLWFNGSIRNAVDKVKSSDVFLLVFVRGDDSLSKQYESYLTEKAKLNDYVAIKISKGSNALQQFKQIYAIESNFFHIKNKSDISVPIPSLFLIQNNGIPFRVVSSDKISDIQNAISDAVSYQKNKKETKNTVHSNKNSSSNATKENNKEILSRSAQHIKNIGWKLFDVSEEELKKRLKEIRGFPKFLLIDSADPGSLTVSPPKQHSARIQFLLPNNTSLSWKFPDLSTLSDVRAYLMEKVKLSTNFKLVRSYPRAALTSKDENKTLAELSLTPSATLIIVPVEDKTVQARVTELLVHRNPMTIILKTLMRPLFTFFNFFKKHVFKIQDENVKIPRRFPSDTDAEKIYNKKTSTSNIHGFKFEEDPDTDTEHPDNGNSTHQRFQK